MKIIHQKVSAISPPRPFEAGGDAATPAWEGLTSSILSKALMACRLLWYEYCCSMNASKTLLYEVCISQYKYVVVDQILLADKCFND